MRRMVLGAEDGKVGDGRDAGAANATAAGVTLRLPEMCDEYERARAEVDSLARDAAEGEAAGPAEGGPDGTHPAPGRKPLGGHHTGAAAGVGPARPRRRRSGRTGPREAVRPLATRRAADEKDEIRADAVEAV